MQNKKMYIFISILVLIMFFSVAALCGQCSLTPATDTEKTDAEKETEAKETEETKEEEGTEEETETTEETSGEKTKPTVELKIYEGPTYSASDGVCYYRVEAKVTGNPKPKVEFSKDDSDGAWGDYKAQINLDDPSDSYTLKATATNSEGSDEDTIKLEWGCDEEVTEPTPEPTEPELVESTVNIDLDTSISGHIVVDMTAVTASSYTYVGDWTNDKQIKAYLSFKIDSIGSLENVTIKDASLYMPVEEIINHPELMPNVHVKVFDYGNSLELADQGAGGTFVKIFPTSNPMANFNFSSPELITELQKAVDADKQWFQLKISLEGININGIDDYYRFMTANIRLQIKYESSA